MKIILISLLIAILAVRGDDLTEDPTDVLKTVLDQPQVLEKLLQKYGLKLNETVVKSGNQEDKFWEIAFKLMDAGAKIFSDIENITEEQKQGSRLLVEVVVTILNDQFNALQDMEIFDLVGLDNSYFVENTAVDWLTAVEKCQKIGGQLETKEETLVIRQLGNSSFWILTDGHNKRFPLLKWNIHDLSDDVQCLPAPDYVIFSNTICLILAKFICERRNTSYAYNLVRFTDNLTKLAEYKTIFEFNK